MPVSMWDGADWIPGTVGVSPGGTGELIPGEVQKWPWVSGTDLVGALSFPAFTANRFGMAEAPEGTSFAANLLWNSPQLEPIRERLIGGCDLRVLSGETGANSLVISFSTFGETTASAWNSKTIASPIAGQPAQPAAFWDNSTYPNKSVAKTWASTQILMPTIKVAGAVTPLINWVTANGAFGSVIAVSETYSECTTMATAGLNVLYKTPGGYPGDGTYTAPATVAAAGIYGVLIPTQYVSPTVVNNMHNAGLKVWTYTANGKTVVDGFIGLGVDGIYTDSPTASIVAPPPTVSVTTYGYGNDTGKNPTGIAGQMGAGLLRPGVIRHFTGSGNASGLSSSVLSEPSALWVSWKPNPDTGMPFPDTWAPSSVANLKTRVGRGKPCYMTVWHEPEGTTDRGSHTLSAWQGIWRDAQAALHELCVAARADGYLFYVAPIICDWTFWDTSKGSAGGGWYTSSFTEYDVMGFDVYPRGQKANGSTMIARLATNGDYNPKPYADAARNDTYKAVRLCSQLALDRGKPWGSGETGIIRGKELGGDSLHLYSKTQRAQLYRNITADLGSLAHPPLLWCWYSHGGCSIVDEPDEQTIAAWNESLRLNPSSYPVP